MAAVGEGSVVRRMMRSMAGWTLPLVFGVFVCEAVARWGLGIEPLTTESVVWQHHDRWGWFHEPEAEDTFVKPGFTQSVRINSLGLRERELPYEKPEGVFRVLVIGDSAVASFEVPPEAVFTRRAEERLQALGLRVQFVNGGVRGYGTDQSLLFLQEEGLKYQPDLVLYHWTSNDREDNATIHRPFRKFGKPWFDVDAEGGLVLRGVPVPHYPYSANLRVGADGEMEVLQVSLRNAALLWLRDHVLCRSAFGTGLVRLALSVPDTNRSLVSMGSYDDRSDVKAELDPHDRLFRVTAAMLQRMEQASREVGAGFRLIGARDRWSLALREATGMPDMGDATRFTERRPPDVPIHMPYDPHLNELGHQLFADALVEALLADGVLPDPARAADRGR